MSVMTCHRCNKFEDTDFFMGLFVLDKYYFCEKCVQKDDLFEIVDKMQEEIDKKHGMIQRAADCAVGYIKNMACHWWADIPGGGNKGYCVTHEELEQALYAHKQIKE